MGNDFSAAIFSSTSEEIDVEEQVQQSAEAPSSKAKRSTTERMNSYIDYDEMEVRKKEEALLDWSSKQSRILTANGKANDYFTNDQYVESECPHYHLQRAENDNNYNQQQEKLRRQYWKEWISSIVPDCKNNNNNHNNMAVCGAWYRSLFLGEWEHSTDHEEYTFNLQSNSLFIDLRIPKLADELLPAFPSMTTRTKNHVAVLTNASSVFQYLSQMSDHQLRLYARRHVFAGITVPSTRNDGNHHSLACTRHHLVDWNYVGNPRPRPNKWYVDTGNYQPTSKDASTINHNINNNDDNDDSLQVWKENSFVKNPNNGQYYYMEKWQRLSSLQDNDDYSLKNCQLALISQDYKSMFIIIGNHFNYVWGRSSHTLSLQQQKQKHYQNMITTSSSLSLVTLVDLALKMGDRNTAELFLSMDAGHGQIFTCPRTGAHEFIIDHAIAYWKNNTSLFSDETSFTIHGTTLEDSTILWNDTIFTIIESSLTSLQQLQSLLTIPHNNDRQLAPNTTIEREQQHEFALNNSSKL